MNNCKIYALSKGQWQLLKQFEVHEDALDFTTEKPPIFDNIKNYLETENGIWVYHDYAQDGYSHTKDVGKMLPLRLDKCK